MKSYKYIILGAGPAGLSLANRLSQLGEKNFLVLEKEHTPGGLCRSENIDGQPVDIGGGHFLDVRNERAVKFLFSFMPENEWNLFDRDSRIQVEDEVVHHPIEANIWEFSKEKQKEYLESIKAASASNASGEVKEPELFIDWIQWKLGSKISEDYMLPYNKKMFGENLNELGTYWLNKLPNVSYDEIMQSIKDHKAYGKQPGHAQFYYPKKYGYGELWERMGNAIKDNMLLDKGVRAIDIENHIVETMDGDVFKGECIINTIPWNAFENIQGLPESMCTNIKKLKHTSVVIELFEQNMTLPCHWLYVPDEDISFHRVLLRHNFAEGSTGYWTETNLHRFAMESSDSVFNYTNEYAYPLNTIDKPAIMRELLGYCKKNNIYGLGRWGEHEHYNSDVTVTRALDLADKLVDEN